MYGFELTLDRDNLKVYGMIFGDASVYAHEPISDNYASLGDLLADHPEVTEVNIIGPVVPVETIRGQMDEDYQHNMQVIADQTRLLSKNYERGKAELAQYEAYSGPVNLMREVDEDELKAA